MNIFYLNECPNQCAIDHCDKHVVKMIIEYAQLLCTAHRVLDGTLYIDKSSGRRIKRWRMDDPIMESTLYKATHINHPSNIWTREGRQNYVWLYDLWECLCREYSHRYDKNHATWVKLQTLLMTPPINIPDVSFFPPHLAMPEAFKSSDHIKAYRNFYIHDKAAFATWKKRDIPQWFKESNASI